MSTIEVVTVRGAIAVAVKSQAGNTTFVAVTKAEANDLITKLCTAVSAANAHEEFHSGQVPDPKPPRKRAAARKAAK